MAEIIYPDFNRKVILKREQLPDPEKPAEVPPADNFASKEEMHRYLYAKLVLKSLDLSILRAMPSYNVSWYTIYLNQFLDPKQTDRWLIDELAKSDQGDWEADPDYYRALDDAIQRRMDNKAQPNTK